MAGWLESLENFGTSIIDAGSEAVAGRIKQELNPDAPNDPANRPETQYDTQIQEPVDGPEATQGAARAISSTLSQYKWWIAGGMAVTAFLALRRAR